MNVRLCRPFEKMTHIVYVCVDMFYVTCLKDVNICVMYTL